MRLLKLGRLFWAIVLFGAGWLAARMVLAGAPVLGVALFLAVAFAAWVYNSPRTHAARYLLPGLATFAVFVLAPLLYTVYIAFTNFSGEHLLSQERVRAWFAQDLYAPVETRHAFRLHPAAEPGKYQVVIPLEKEEMGRNLLISRPFTPQEAEQSQPILLGLNIAPPRAKALGIRDVVAARAWLRPARFTAPGQSVPLRMISLRELGYRLPRWEEDNGGLVNAVTGQRLVPDSSRGNFVDAATGEAVGPGWRVWIGTANFRLIFTDPAIREPFLKIFAWNVVFALLSVATTFVIGVCLASLLQWKALRGRAIYRTLLILPYAIPAFIPILVFRGLFNEGYGEINHVLTALFGIAPKWFTDPMLARTMILIVNAWLGYPYMMIISSGMLQAVPDELYEATAVDGAGPWTNFTKVTLPQIFPPLFPLLIASFAFNFNNFSLIYLLTGGKPDITGSATVAGTTDLLVSYTFRMAFKDSSARFGFASAVATLLFIIVAILAWLQLRWSRAPAAKGAR
ncbi:MAG TPA: maltose ABC transporter permease MalF [Kiritimatiellia bacterium]|jgi:maltose/maltodextrin transport system permease protein|nr:maltose ABC transporter permease MalF [Kiritimatiellia bacterium]